MLTKFKIFISLGLLSFIALCFQNCGGFNSIDQNSSSGGIGGGDNAVQARAVTWESTAGRTFIEVDQASNKVSKNDLDSEARRNIYADIVVSQGRHYFEITVASVFSGGLTRVGLASLEGRKLDETPDPTASRYGIHLDGSFSNYANNNYTSDPATDPLNVGDVIGIYFDMESKTSIYFVNGEQVVQHSLQAGHRYSPYIWFNNNQNSSFIANFGKRPFRYAPNHLSFDPLDKSGLSQARSVYKWSLAESGPNLISIDSSNGLVVTKDSRPENINASAYSEFELDVGKWYFEAELLQILSGQGLRFGVASTEGREPENGTTAEPSYGYGIVGEVQMHVDGGFARGTQNTASVGVGDVIGLALDLDNGVLSFYVNGVYQSQQSIYTDGLKYSALFHGNTGSNGTIRANFGSQPFRHAVPLGFSAPDLN